MVLIAAGASLSPCICRGIDTLGIGDTDNDTSTVNAAKAEREPTNLLQDNEIWVFSETTLDNGITFGAKVELEAFSRADQIDES
jgi:hypothetical protein